MAKEKGIKFVCDLCGQLIEIGRPRFILRGEIFCAYDGGQFDETTDIPRESIRQEMQKLIDMMEKRNEKDLNDEVHYAFNLDLCPACRKRIYSILERSEQNE
ncbi:MAG: hypothetical protein JXR73_18040 [Candidatus Omnitrophica bacterium]|nr:hypothetical protein [Candidatus Omnitrophota bacterium]